MFYVSLFTLAILIPQVWSAYSLKLSSEMENASPVIRVIVRSVIIIASMVNLHHVLLVFTCFGAMFQSHDCKWPFIIRIYLQLLLIISIISVLQTTS
jgi:hypothetical protein